MDPGYVFKVKISEGVVRLLLTSLHDLIHQNFTKESFRGQEGPNVEGLTWTTSRAC